MCLQKKDPFIVVHCSYGANNHILFKPITNGWAMIGHRNIFLELILDWIDNEAQVNFRHSLNEEQPPGRTACISNKCHMRNKATQL